MIKQIIKYIQITIQTITYGQMIKVQNYQSDMKALQSAS